MVVGAKIKHLFITQPGGREWVTELACIRRNGETIPPMIIFTGKLKYEPWYDQLKDLLYIHHAGLTCSDNGWTNKHIALDWLEKLFIPWAGRSTLERKYGMGMDQRKRMLILDGHDSHITYSFTMKCHAAGVILLQLPPHSTHHLQPLDVGTFNSVQGAYSVGVTRKSDMGYTSVSKPMFLELLNDVYRDGYKVQTIRNSFEACGLVHMDAAPVLKRLHNKAPPERKARGDSQLLPPQRPATFSQATTASELSQRPSQATTVSPTPLPRPLVATRASSQPPIYTTP